MNIRLETEKDHFENENLTREAFWDVYRPGCSEHLVLHKLRTAESFIPELNFVAEDNGRLIGNIVYVHMYKDGNICSDMIGFGPVSVIPDMQKRGVGSRLITETMQLAKDMGYKGILITGDCNYYSRFGFVPASRLGIHLEGVPVEDEAPFFMAKELEEGSLSQYAGTYDFDVCYNVDDNETEEFDKQFPPKKKREPKDTDLQ